MLLVEGEGMWRRRAELVVEMLEALEAHLQFVWKGAETLTFRLGSGELTTSWTMYGG